MRLSQLPIPDQLVEDLNNRENGKVTFVVERGGQPAKVVASRRCISVILVPTIVVVDDPWDYPSVVWESSLDKVVAVEIEREKGQQPVRWLRKHEKFDFLRVEGDLPEVEIYSPHFGGCPIKSSTMTSEEIDRAMEQARLECQTAELKTQLTTETAAAPAVVITAPVKSRDKLAQAILACEVPEASKRLKTTLSRWACDENFSDSEFVAMVEALM